MTICGLLAAALGTSGCNDGQDQKCESAECSASAPNPDSPAPTLCSSHAPMCDGDVATTCDAQGAGPAPGGQDCSATGQLCSAGKCVGKLSCPPGERLCVGDDVYLCSDNGHSLTLFDACEPGTACDDASASCNAVSEACEAGERFCQDGNVYKCGAGGSASVLVEECTSERPCLPSFRLYSYAHPETSGPGGADCLLPYQDVPCTPNQMRCLSGTILAQCNASGTSSMPIDNCAPDFMCLDGGCEKPRCEYNSARCSGDKLLVCSLGDYVPLDCPPDTACWDDHCAPKICTPGALSCQWSDIWRCERGVTQEHQAECPVDAPCDDTTADVHCLKTAHCAPGSTACQANQVGQCAEDGLSLTSVTTDCAAQNQICDSQGGCADSVLDEMGGNDESAVTPGNDDFHGDLAMNVVCTDSTRKLIRIEMALTLSAPTALGWVVIKDIPNGQVEDPEGTATSMTTQAEPGTGYYASGTFDARLEAGSCYLLGVWLPAGSLLHFDKTPAEERSLSFGLAVGGLFGGVEAALTDRTILYQMRVVTEPL